MGRLFRGLIAALVIGLFVAMAAEFASIQAIWVDETTQLSGLALGFQEQLLWLVGRSEAELGVPPDRMPPLSYWLGGLWAAVFGLSEISLRWFGIVAVLAATPALYLAGHHLAGWRGGLFCLAFCLLSPNMIVYAVEIRAYPVFFAFAAWGCLCFVRLVVEHEEPSAHARMWLLTALAATVLAAAYTHYYGVVFGVCLLVALCVDRIVKRASLLPLLSVAAVTALLALGLIPFVLVAIGMSGGTEPSSHMAADISSMPVLDALKDTARLAVRTVTHGSHFVYITAAALVLLGVAGLGLLAVWERAQMRDGVLVFLPVLVALPLLCGLSLLISGFDLLAPHYNIWLIPLVAIGLSAALRVGSLLRMRMAQIACVAAVTGQLMASFVFQQNAQYFTHGPGEWVADSIEEPAQTLIVYDEEGPWGQVYFPVYFATQGQVTQLLLQPDGSAMRLTPTGLEPIEIEKERLRAQFATVLEISVRRHNMQFLARKIRGAEACGGGEQPGYFGSDAVGPADTYCAFAAASVYRIGR